MVDLGRPPVMTGRDVWTMDRIYHFELAVDGSLRNPWRVQLWWEQPNRAASFVFVYSYPTLRQALVHYRQLIRHPEAVILQEVL